LTIAEHSVSGETLTLPAMSRPGFALLSLILVSAGCSRNGSQTAATRAHGAPTVIAVSAPEVQALVARPGARATLVNVWATWCPPCREEFPALVKVGKTRRDDGLRLIFVSADMEDQVGDVRKFLTAHGVTDTVYIMTGDAMTFINALNPKWTGALPATFVYNGRGELASFWEGAADEAEFNHSVDQAIATQ